MKKNYQKPLAEVYNMNIEKGILIESYRQKEPDGTRTVRYRNFLDSELGSPIEIDNYNDGDDPWGNAGQDGNTNRSKDFDLWDDTGW